MEPDALSEGLPGDDDPGAHILIQQHPAVRENALMGGPAQPVQQGSVISEVDLSPPIYQFDIPFQPHAHIWIRLGSRYHSTRSDSTGSTCDALRAGSQLATRATTDMSTTVRA